MDPRLATTATKAPGSVRRAGPLPLLISIVLMLLGLAFFGMGSLALLGSVLEATGEVERTSDGPAAGFAGSLFCCFAPGGLAWFAAWSLHRRGRSADGASDSTDALPVAAEPRTEPPRKPASATSGAIRVACAFCDFVEDRDAEPARREKCPKCRAPLVVRPRP